MRRLIFIAIFFALAAASSVAKDETLAQMKSRFEGAHVEERAELGIKIAQLQLRDADALYGKGDAEPARVALEEIVAYSEKASDAAKQSDKHMKTVEIDVRKISDKLRDIKRTLSADDQPPVEQAIRRLEDIRTSLLKEMFAKKKAKK